MPRYRLNFMDGSGRTKRSLELHFGADAEAIEAARRHQEGDAMELWSLARCIHKFAATKPRRRRPKQSTVRASSQYASVQSDATSA